MKWAIVGFIVGLLRRTPYRVRLLLGFGLWGLTRFGTTRFHYAVRSVALSVLVRECGDRLIVGPGVFVLGFRKLSLGSDVSMNHFVYIDASGGLTIRDGVRIGNHSTIVTGNHDLARGEIDRRPVVIETGAWIGSGVRVLAGTTIGRNATIGAGAVVTRDIPAHATAVGVPARVLAKRHLKES